MKVLLVFMLSVVSLYGVITIAPVDIGKKPGASGVLKGSFETKRGNSDVDNYSAVLYYQPKFEDMSDYIFSNGLELEVLVYKTLYLSFVTYYDIDSKPAVGVKYTDFTQKTSFIYKFYCSA